MKKTGAIALLALLVAILAGCGLNVPTGQGQYYWVELQPSQWGFEVDNSGMIKIAQNAAQVLVAPGAPAAVLEKVEVAYYDGEGNLLFEDDAGYSGSLPVAIPEGIICTGSDTVCTKDSSNWEYGWAKSEKFTFSMQGKVAISMLDEAAAGNPTLGWHAHVVFHAHTLTNVPISWQQDINIIYPLTTK